MSAAGERIRVRVSYVLQLLDDFTGKVMERADIMVRGDENQIPVRKPDGYFVFTNCPEKMKITISSPCFHEEILETDGWRPGTSVIKVRLKPSRLYPLPEGITCITGKAPIGSRIGVVFEQESTSWKLLYDYSAKQEPLRMELYNPGEQELEGKWFIITDRTGKNRELFSVERYLMSEQKCILSVPLTKDYKKAGTKLYEFHFVSADGNGEYYLPVKDKIEDTAVCWFYIGEEMQKKEIQPGRLNRIDL